MKKDRFLSMGVIIWPRENNLLCEVEAKKHKRVWRLRHQKSKRQGSKGPPRHCLFVSNLGRNTWGKELPTRAQETVNPELLHRLSAPGFPGFVRAADGETIILKLEKSVSRRLYQALLALIILEKARQLLRRSPLPRRQKARTTLKYLTKA